MMMNTEMLKNLINFAIDSLKEFNVEVTVDDNTCKRAGEEIY